MPLISCPSCRSVYDVPLKSMGKTTKCPKCTTRFKAVAKLSGPRRKQASAAPYWIGGTILAFGTLIIAASMTGDDPPPDPGALPGDQPAGTPVASASSGTTAPPPTIQKIDPSNVENRARQVLSAIETDDQSTLLSLVSYPRFQAQRVAKGEDDRAWSTLDSMQQNLTKQDITERLLGSEVDRKFLREAKIESVNITAQEGTTTEVQIIHRGILDERKTQQRNIELCEVGGAWFVTWMTTGKVQDPESVAEEVTERRITARNRRASRHLGVVEHVENLADTSAEDQAKIDSLAAILADLDATREASRAKRELEAIGKPAIPALLNLIVGREQLTAPDDQQVVNQSIQVLRAITHSDFGFAPGGLGNSLTGNDLGGRREALQRWFGWWNVNKDRWTGPPEPDPEEDDEDGGT